MIFDRRVILGSLAAAAGGLVSPALAVTDASGDRLHDFMRMRGLCTGRLAIGCLTGQYNGVVDGAVTPLFGVTAATFAQYSRAGADYKIVASELAYFTDLATGAALDSWLNPYTHETVHVPVSRMPPVTMHIGTDLRFRSDGPDIPGMRVSQIVTQPTPPRGEIVFMESVTAVMNPGPGLPSFFYNDNTVMRTRRDDIAKDEFVPVNCSTSFQSIVSWRPWMKMGTRPGAMVGFGIGRYGASIDKLPADWVTATRKYLPEVLTDPNVMLAASK